MLEFSERKFLSLLLNHPNVLKKVQDELDEHICKTRQVDDSDIKKLVYLQAIFKESLRLYPPRPLISLRSALEDCVLSNGNYRVPAGTRLMINVWKIHRDPAAWPEPEQFKPERFLRSTHKDMDVRGQSFEFIPFGSGRRSCPGTSLALQVVQFSLARRFKAINRRRGHDRECRSNKSQNNPFESSDPSPP